MILNFTKFKLFENQENQLVIKKGSELFHATGEDFNISELKTGGYDNVLWTTTDSGISQMYIPVSGSYSFVRASEFTKPSRSASTQAIQKQLGIDFDYDDIEFDGNRVVGGYSTPSIFNHISEQKEEISKKFRELRDIKSKLEEEIINIGVNISKRPDLKQQYKKVNAEFKEYDDKLSKFNPEKLKNEIVNNILQNKFNYTPESTDNYTKDHTYKLKTKINELLPSDYRLKGKLIILKPKVDLLIFDYSKDREGDLSDVDYNKLNLFKMVEENGYDGIKIHDFAQSDSFGNFGHTSIGLFSSTIEKLEISVIDNVEHPDEEQTDMMYRSRDWRSKEYKAS